jgi:hypothetical protein
LDGWEGFLHTCHTGNFGDGLITEDDIGLLLGIVSSILGMALLFQLADDGFVLPAHTLGKISKNGVLSARAEAVDSQGGRDNDALNLLVGRGHTFEALNKSKVIYNKEMLKRE